MRIITVSTLRAHWQKHPDAKAWLTTWILITRKANWVSLVDVRKTYPHADPANAASGAVVTIFNVCRHKYRLIVAIHYRSKRVYVREFLTHAEYSKNHWKARN